MSASASALTPPAVPMLQARTSSGRQRRFSCTTLFTNILLSRAAESTTITVFVESAVGEPVANNYVYLDDAVLEVATDNVVVDSTPTSEVNDELVEDDQEEATPTQEPTAIEIATEEPTETEEATATEEAAATEEPVATEELVPTATLTSEPDKDAGASGNENRAESTRFADSAIKRNSRVAGRCY